MHRFIKRIAALPALMMAIGLAGCADETEIHRPVPGAGNDVMITVNIPGSQLPTTPTLRSTAGANGEAVVKTIDILVFKADGSNPDILTQHVKGENITQSDDENDSYQVQFKAKLSVDSEATRVVLVANASAQVDAAVEAAGGVDGSAAKTAILSNLTFISSGKWNATGSSNHTPIPMYGEETVNGITKGMKIEDVELIRMLARIDIKNSASGFTLENVYLCSYNKAGYIAPAWNTATGTLFTESDATYPYTNNLNPVLPADAAVSGMIDYDYAELATAEGMLGEIYTYEAHKASGEEGDFSLMTATCLIIKGVYDNEYYYYRIDFTDGKDEEGRTVNDAGFDPSTIDYMPLYRNHRYIFDIESVGVGYPDAVTALTSLGIKNNLKTNLHVVDESQLNNIIFNGEHYLGVGDDVTFDYQAGTAKVLVKTNYRFGWQVEKIEYTTTETGWLTAIKEDELSAKRGYLQLTAKANNGDEDRTAIVHLSAGRLKYELNVTQEFATVRIDVVDAGDNSITELVFASSEGIPSVPQLFKVNWKPTDANLDITLTGVSNPAFPAGAGQPSTGVPANGMGTVSYTVSPGEMPASEIVQGTGNPFLEKVSRLDLQTTDGIEVASTSLLLRQINYALIAEDVDSYMLDGGTYTFTVKSNAAWRIKAITQDIDDDAVPSLLNNGSGDNLVVGTTGGPDTATGKEISFTLINDTDEEGYTGIINVTFESIDDMFLDVTIPLEIVFGEWARSNIVWMPSDDLETYPDGGYLTFAVTPRDNITKIPANSQGLFFKWGSLVAISPASFSTQTNAYLPYTAGKFPSGHIVYSPTGIYNYTYSTIPYVDDVNAPFHNNTQTEDDFDSYGAEGNGFDETVGKGDICRFVTAKGWVKGKWRLPTAQEAQNLIDMGSPVSTGIFNGQLIVTPNGSSSYGLNAYGYYLFNTGAWFGSDISSTGNSITSPTEGVFLPVTGMRRTDGTAVVAGTQGNYKTSSSSNANINATAWGLYVSPNIGLENEYGRRESESYTWVARCVRE